jgi:ketosteroid isomerase-like protein
MSQENVDLVSQMYRPAEAMSKDDLLASLPELIQWIADPEIEWVEAPNRVDGRTYRGHEGVRQAFHHWLDGFDEYSFELERIIDYGDAVLVVAHEEGRGAASGVPVSVRSYQVFTIRAGKVVRYQGFADEASAREGAGLRQ